MFGFVLLRFKFMAICFSCLESWLKAGCTECTLLMESKREKRRGRREEKGGKEEKVRRKREHKTALKNRPQSLFLSMRSYLMPIHEVISTMIQISSLSSSSWGQALSLQAFGERYLKLQQKLSLKPHLLPV